MLSLARAIGDPVQQLFNAVITEDFGKIDALIKAGSISMRGTAPDGGKQVLHVAAEFGLKKESFDKLIALGANAQAKTARGFTPLHIAAQKGSVVALTSLIRAGALLDAVTDDDLGVTPLQEAAYFRHLDAVKVLVAAGANGAYRERKYGLNAIDLSALKKIGMAPSSGSRAILTTIFSDQEPPTDEITDAILGFRVAFIKNTKAAIIEWDCTHAVKTADERLYLDRLLAIDPKAMSTDNYFLALRTLFTEASLPPGMITLKRAVTSLMKAYNVDSKFEHTVRAQIMPEVMTAPSISK